MSLIWEAHLVEGQNKFCDSSKPGSLHTETQAHTQRDREVSNKEMIVINKYINK